ncbi:MAG TPA: RnfABCDGE type electron transport complex subunit B [Polyangiales bacterium]
MIVLTAMTVMHSLTLVMVLTSIALAFGFLLALTAKKLAVPSNPLIEEVDEELPKGQCGSCGFAGCAQYAEAVVTRPDVLPNLCVPGGNEVANIVSILTGKKAAELKPRKAVVLCRGVREQTTAVKHLYEGLTDCVAANQLYGGDLACEQACLGFGNCVRACTYGAMSSDEHGTPIIDARKCTGCGNCVTACPRGVIELIETDKPSVVRCRNHDGPERVREICSVGCEACKNCVEICPHGAISIVDNVAVVDYVKCQNCPEPSCLVVECKPSAISTNHEHARPFTPAGKLDPVERIKLPRQHEEHLPAETRRTSFDEVNHGMSEEIALTEILRCVHCQSPTCVERCPIHNCVPTYFDNLANGDLIGAIQLLRKTNPMPSILGRVCPHPCEAKCVRGKKTESASIHAVERYVGDMERRLKQEGKIPRPTQPQGIDLGKVAVIGAGPVGITGAFDLAKKGYKVTIFERSPVGGGMMHLGIPEYRLPRDVIDDVFADLRSLNVEVRHGEGIDKDRTPQSFLAQGYQAVLLGIGAYKGLTLGIPGEGEYEGFIDVLEFLRTINLGDKSLPGKKILVIGGGNSAIDGARTALRLGCSDVNIVYRRSRAEMPANPEEIDDAEKERVTMHYQVAPVRIVGENGRVTGMEVIRQELGEPDASGRRKPVPVKGSEYIIPADLIVPAISQKPDLSSLSDGHGFTISKWDSFDVDKNMATNVEGIFAAGDAVTGPATVVEAIAAAHKAASAIDQYCSAKRQAVA